MKTKEEMVKYLTDTLVSVYCYNCAYVNHDDCDDCYRKMMGWGLSEKAAKEIIDELLSDEQ